MAKTQSRPARWNTAVAEARAALEVAQEHVANLHEALAEITGVKEEYQEWRDNLPEGLDQSATAELLDAIIELDFELEVDLSEVEQAIDEAEGVQLPLGFGRD